ncbi:MAG TPA: hypothetical protein VHD62_14880 [Opitutaceae bacterium]|nr:hypothetical protein [Opitutaceae bacterium]
MPTFPLAMFVRLPPTADLLRRLVAAGCAALILALTVFAASPAAHDWLHAKDGAHGDDHCAVVLFASGVSLPLGAIAALPPTATIRAAAVPAAEEIYLASPRYLRQPERGPPVS